MRPRVWSCLHTWPSKAERRALSLFHSASEYDWRASSREWVRLVIFTPGQNGWTQVTGSVAVSALFCICEFVFSLPPIINRLLDVWVLASGILSALSSSTPQKCNKLRFLLNSSYLFLCTQINVASFGNLEKTLAESHNNQTVQINWLSGAQPR